MKKAYFLFLAFLISVSVFAQSYDSAINDIINEVNLDSLVFNVRVLSGEDSTFVNGEKVLIKTRAAQSGNELAAEYITERLENYGLSVTQQNFGSEGTNVVATQTGTDFPNEYYMICAHYDAVTYYAADDNASGTATVIEAARLLSGQEFPYSIIYALWDEEEIGLVGSAYYASHANTLGLNIEAVINIDMIGWDGNDDGLIEVHTTAFNDSERLSYFVLNMNSIYSLNLLPTVINPGTTYSDHSSFWDNGFSAVLLIEGYYSNDFNPYYHSVNDRISKFNLPYFHKSAKLAIGSLSSLAMSNITSVENYFGTSEDISTIANHPNPFSNETSVNIQISKESFAHVFVVNNLGQKVKEIYQGKLEKGSHSISMNSNNLQDGIYFLVLQTEDERVASKMIISR
jgi:hypothetical protein